MYTMRHVVQGAAPTPQRTTAKLMKTGQSTSYRTGDDGDIEAGRDTSFTVLAENNPFGNTNRFTDELGGQTYTNNIVIDWSTYDGSSVLGYRRTFTNVSNWNSAIDGALAVSIGSFTSGWRLCNAREYLNIFNFESATSRLNYAPFNISTSFEAWTSTTYKQVTANAYYVDHTGIMSISAKTNPATYIPCRTFTVTGTTLS